MCINTPHIVFFCCFQIHPLLPPCYPLPLHLGHMPCPPLPDYPITVSQQPPYLVQSPREMGLQLLVLLSQILQLLLCSCFII